MSESITIEEKAMRALTIMMDKDRAAIPEVTSLIVELSVVRPDLAEAVENASLFVRKLGDVRTDECTLIEARFISILYELAR